MPDWLDRTRMLIGDRALAILQKSRVAVFGVGGVGSYAAEALARAGVGALLLVDHDTVSPTNINRQVHALHSTVGLNKVDAMRARIRDINPGARVEAQRVFVTAENAPLFVRSGIHYVVDAMDTVSAKVAVILCSQASSIPVVSGMGAGNKLDPARLEVADIYETTVCPLCRVMRAELKKRGVTALKVVYSKEPPIKPLPAREEITASRKSVGGSVSFVPSAAGLMLAGVVVRDLIADAL